MIRSSVPRWHKQISAGVFAAATIAMAVGGLLQPSVSHAEKVFDKKSYDSCAVAAEKRWVNKETDDATFNDELKFCCGRSGGVWTVSSTGGGSCGADTATFAPSPTPIPGQVATVPGQASLPGTKKG